MNRGQYWGIGRFKLLWRAALCVGILCAAMAGAASARGELQARPQPDRSWESYFGVAILSSGRTIVVGDKGLVMTSDDAGRTWTRHHLKKGLKYYDLYSVAFTPDGSRGWAVGDDGAIFRTDDGGMSWSDQNGPPGLNTALLKIAVADGQRFCAVGEHGALVCTSDGGASWNLQKFRDLVFFDLTFTDPQNVWAVGEFATLLHSADDGKSWKVLNGGELGKGDPLFSIGFDGRQGLAVGLIGTSLQSSDGGATWQAHELPIAHRSLYTVNPVPSQTGEFYAAGDQGSAALITNGEVTPVPSGVATAIAASAFSPHFAIAVGLSGTILRSDDGGRHWRPLVNKSQTLMTQAQ
jgi:photosystem II stability/assembly factor-like uncharacterized protein